VAWDILPSRAKIGRFVVSDDPDAWVCPFVKGMWKHSHIFLDCHLARILWRSSPWPLSLLAFSFRHISVWALAIISPVVTLGIPRADVRKFQLFAALVMDYIWRARNQLLHEGSQPSPNTAIHQISSTFNHRCNAWNDLALSSIWTPPAAGWIKGNFDVAVRGSFAVAAAVISDDNGSIFAAATLKLNSADALQGEAHAALLVARLATSLGFGSFLLEGYALLVILAINSPSLFSS
jgi:hypothetical protein